MRIRVEETSSLHFEGALLTKKLERNLEINMTKPNHICAVIEQSSFLNVFFYRNKFVRYRKIPDISPGLMLFQRHFLGWLITAGAYNGGEFCVLLLNHKIHFLRSYNYRSLQNYFHHLQFYFRYQVQIQLFH